MNKIFGLCNSIIMGALLSSMCWATNLEVDDRHHHRGMTITPERNNPAENQVYKASMQIFNKSQEDTRVVRYAVGSLFFIASSWAFEEGLKEVIKSKPIRWGLAVGTCIFSAVYFFKYYESLCDERRKEIMRRHGVTL